MIVFALRHADRTSDGDDLSAAGRQRAELLARMLAETGVSVAYRSDTVRAARTLEPLKQKLGAALTVEEVGFAGQNAAASHITKIVERIQALPPSTVVALVGHSDTVGPILERLGSEPVSEIKHTEFDKLFVLFVGNAGSPTLLKLRYGPAT
jgi:phosphohistidine phosphatase SixA